MKGILITALFILNISISKAQSALDKARVERVKENVVAILIDNQTYGTGFFCSNKGQIVTCWHVIEPAIIPDTLHKTLNFRKVEIKTRDGKKFSYKINPYYLNTGNSLAKVLDYCLIEPSTPGNYPHLSNTIPIGKFSDIEEGDFIYTCGFPLGLEQHFITSGYLSSKFKSTFYLLNESGNKIDSISRNQAWLDLTMNKGNSGGPIIKLGKTLDEDRIIGISTFIRTPFYNEIQEIQYRLEILRKVGGEQSIEITNAEGKKVEINLMETISMIAEALNSNSTGISGCVSIDHFMKTFK